MFLSSVTIYIKGIECFGVHIYFILVIILKLLFYPYGYLCKPSIKFYYFFIKKT